MEMWELVRRLIGGANGGGQSFTPGLIGDLYRRDLVAAKQEIGFTYQEVLDLADCLSEQMQEEGLIRPAGVRGRGAAILGAMERTNLVKSFMTPFADITSLVFSRACMRK
jgi:hypothetical protein